METELLLKPTGYRLMTLAVGRLFNSAFCSSTPYFTLTEVRRQLVKKKSKKN